MHLSPLQTFTEHRTGSDPISIKVAAFDLDGTLIRFAGFGTKGPVKFDWWRTTVPGKLKELHAEGYEDCFSTCSGFIADHVLRRYLIAIVSNQKYKGKSLQRFQDKVPLIARALAGIPFYIFAATSDDKFRKPGTGMWDALVSMLEVEGATIGQSDAIRVLFTVQE